MFNNKFISKIKANDLYLIGISIFSLLCFLSLAFNVMIHCQLVFYDKIADDLLNNIASKHSISPVIFITSLATMPVLVVLSIIISLFLLKYRHYEKIILLFTVITGETLLNKLAKLFFGRLRPIVPCPLVHENGYSFPSGHSMNAISFYGFLIYLSYIYIKNNKIRIPAILGLSLLILLIGFSRIYLGVHYPSDVLGGFSLGLFWLSLCIFVEKAFLKKRWVKL